MRVAEFEAIEMAAGSAAEAAAVLAVVVRVAETVAVQMAGASAVEVEAVLAEVATEAATAVDAAATSGAVAAAAVDAEAMSSALLEGKRGTEGAATGWETLGSGVAAMAAEAGATPAVATLAEALTVAAARAWAVEEQAVAAWAVAMAKAMPVAKSGMARGAAESVTVAVTAEGSLEAMEALAMAVQEEVAALEAVSPVEDAGAAGGCWAELEREEAELTEGVKTVVVRPAAVEASRVGATAVVVMEVAPWARVAVEAAMATAEQMEVVAGVSEAAEATKVATGQTVTVVRWAVAWAATRQCTNRT